MNMDSPLADASIHDALTPFAAELQRLTAQLEQWPLASGFEPMGGQAVGELLDDLQTLEQSLLDLREYQAESIERLEALRGDGQDLFGELQSGVASALSGLDERAQSFVADELSEIGDRLGDKIEEVGEAARELLDASHAECVSSLSSAAAERISQAGTNATEVAEGLHALIETETADAIRDACEETVGRIAGTAKKSAEDALGSVAAELAENIALSQISTTVMATVSPILPQLVAAKIALTAIREALKILRMGF